MTDQYDEPPLAVPQLPPIPLPPAPRTLLEAAQRIQTDAADLKAVVPWLETQTELSYWQRYMVFLAHQSLNVAGALLQRVLGQKEGTFFCGGGPKP